MALIEPTTDPASQIMARRRELIRALRTRILTAEEMDKVFCEDYRLLTSFSQPYNPTEKMREFNDLMLLQFKMRLEVERAAKK